MRSSEECRDFIKQFESLELEAYPDPGSKDGKPWTIGFGHTGPEVVPGLKITKAYAGRLLVQDLKPVEDAIERLVKVPLVQKEFDALVSFTFNEGIGRFEESTLLRLLNLGKRAEAADEFPRWNLNDGKVMGGLVKRRAAERRLFQGLSYSEAIKAGEKAYEIYKQRLQDPRA